MPSNLTELPWLAPGMLFPPAQQAWGPGSDAPGLLAIGADLTPTTLQSAYSNGIFPWFSEGQPILWWSPDPRMVLQVAQFRLHRSLRKTLVRFISDSRCEIRIDSAFAQVIESCARTPRKGANGTWIVPAMVQAYNSLHIEGCAHSVETWVNGELVGGLYCVSLGKAVFGESMFSHASDASKIALAALVAWCRANVIDMIDCQQNTSHLASVGAAEMPREAFISQVRAAQAKPRADWRFAPIYWEHLLST
jgi:leucyl/phenylalanyl-tRNA---protein transferase